MPAIYAHDRFGHLVFQEMQGEVSQIIKKYYTQFQIGLQGPDIFFFCRPWNGPVNRYGNRLHQVSVKPFLERAMDVVRETGRDSARYGYLLGFLCHYILDSECHGYVEEMVKATGAGHLEVEEEFEKMLLRLDGEDPLAYKVADLIPTDVMTVQAITPFYARGISDKIVETSLKDMRMVKNVFTAPNPVKQAVINGILKVAGLEDHWKGLMNQRKDNLACIRSNGGLLERFEAAVPVAVEMLHAFDQSLQNGTSLQDRFDRNFE